MNGVDYVFGTTKITTTSQGRITVPPSIPSDVDVYLDRSTTLSTGGWTPVVSWVNGTAPTFASGLSLLVGEVIDTFAGPKSFYRYRIVKR